MKTCKCGKCNGKGFLPEYRGIMGGKCFACKGTGDYKDSGNKKYQIGIKEVGGEIIGLFWIKSKTEELALKKGIERITKTNNFNNKEILITGVM